MKIKSNYIYLTVILLLVFLIGYLTQCNGKETPISNNDPLHDSNVILNHEINKSTTATDSRETRLEAGKDTIVKFEIRYKTKVIEIIKLAPDTCNPYLIALVNEAGYLDSIKSTHILRQDSSITDYKKQIGLLKKVASNDTTRITQLSDSLRTERKSKKKYFRGLKHGIATGVLLSGAVYVGTILK